jgi:uncharacterized protein YcbX
VVSVSLISITPVRMFALDHPDEVVVTEEGVVENRRFLLVDGEGNRLRSSATPWPVVIRARYDPARERLGMRFPDGTEVEGSALELGETVSCEAAGGQIDVSIVEGPWTEPLTQLAGRPVRVGRPDRPGEALVESVTLLSEASVERLAREAGQPVDGRRFRMLFTLRGCRPHEEDEWRGRLFRVGEAVLRVGGPVDRCAVTTRDPDTGTRDLDTLRLIEGYRGRRDGKLVDFGVYATVERPGRVRVGDPVEALEPEP